MTTYWAVLDENNIVTQVTTGVDDLIINGIPASDYYSNSLNLRCVQTWIDRDDKTYAGIGFEYSYETEDFIPPYYPPSPPYVPEPIDEP
jgi:hypothetical protein